MGSWTSVSKLTVILDSGQHQGLLNQDQIGVVISIQPTDEDGNEFVVDISDLYKSVNLIDFVDGSLLPEYSETESKEWSWEKAKDFTPNPGMTPQIKYNVRHTVFNPGRKVRTFGVRVGVPNKKALYSSQNGTYQSSVQVEAR
ncbi:hypothetical protein [Streptomyces sp. NPDC088789]|uniref:hypothetical protein n=1 Tax=Streptomyces sp. NPDC088789 TaxID=3365899 RepID=UPI0038294BBB